MSGILTRIKKVSIYPDFQYIQYKFLMFSEGTVQQVSGYKEYLNKEYLDIENIWM